jgi:hypothetical protein
LPLTTTEGRTLAAASRLEFADADEEAGLAGMGSAVFAFTAATG